MKTTISVPAAVFEEAERVGPRLGKSRSQLYAEAIAEYIARHGPEPVTEAIDRVGAQPDEFASTCGQRILRHSEW